MRNQPVMAFFLFVLLLITTEGYGQSKSGEQALFDFALAAESYQEGFAKSHPGNDFSYHSFRNDLSESLLTRCTDGSMAIEWETSEVKSIDKSGVGFIWITAIDMTGEKASFSLKVNGIQRFIIPTGSLENFELTTADGGRLTFITVEKDQHADAHGYMALWAPKSWLIPGQPLTLTLTGSAAQSNSWVIVYKANDAAAYLKESVKYNAWANVYIHNLEKVDISLPSSYISKPVTVRAEKKNYPVTVLEKEGKGYVSLNSFKNLSLKSSFILSDEYGEILSLSAIGVEGPNTQLSHKALLQSEVSVSGNDIDIKAARIYKPKTINSLNSLSGTCLSKGKIYLMNSSHQDIAWMDSPEKCILLRDTMLLTPLLQRAETDSTYRFDIEDALMLKEYISRHPNKKTLVAELLKKGRISCGSSYIQPYEEIYSGEALARQFYFGSRWLKKEFGYAANTYWNQDVPGRTLQMPQVLRKSGNEFLALSRMQKGIFNWYSPDGSYITTYSAGHYGNDFTPLQRNFYEATEYIARNSLGWASYYGNKAKEPVIPLFSDWDMSPAKDYSQLISRWNQINKVKNEKGQYTDIQLPKIQLSLTPDFLKDFCQQAEYIPSRKGERPAVWLFIHGPTHQKAIKASREADILLTAAEKFATANALYSQSFRNYPTTKLNKAWEARLYPDHGWGGKHGDITDALFQEKYYQAREDAGEILNLQLHELASSIKTQTDAGIPLVVFNSLSSLRSDPVSAEIHFDRSFAWNIQLKDAGGHLIPTQMESKKVYDDGSLESINLWFIATELPSVGYRTYYLTPSPAGNENNNVKPDEFENRFYKIKFCSGGIASLYDKELGEELLDTTYFKGAEVFTLKSEGTGAGEFADIQQPTSEGFEKASNYASIWKCVESGPVFTEYLLDQPIRNAKIEERIRVYHTIKRIDIRIALLNYEGILYREYRMAMPLRYKNPDINYEVPYGVLKVGRDELEGAAGERYTTECKDIHPRGIGNWINVNGSETGITMSSSVAVVDYIDPIHPGNHTLLQPILISSRRSCHEEGNEYLQTGNHDFEFSLFSHASGWQNGFQPALGANEKLFTILDPKPYQSASLPEELSFFSTNSAELVITAVKKQEDGAGTAIRVVNLGDENKTLELKSYTGINSCNHADLLEYPIKAIPCSDNSFKFIIGKAGIETFIVK